MLEIIREYSFDVNFETGKFKRTDGSEERIKLVQNDNESTKFKFNFEEEIADNTNVLVRLRQSTGYVKEYTMLIQNQKAEIILTNDILSESGLLTMSITLIGTDDEILTDTEYHSKMYVLASLEGNTEIPEQEKNVLVDLISQVNSLNQTASQLVEDTETAVTNSSTVLANAETALQNANTATQNANDATTNANTATQNANVAAQNANNAVTELDNRLATKVDKVNGKELSTNDYDNTEKEKNETNRTEILRRALITETGNKIELEINNQTYILTAKLYDKNNNLISTSNSIDLPLETMIVNATYNNTTKKIVLTLQSGTIVEFSIADLIDGLVNETTFNETIEELEAENTRLKQRVADLENNELVDTSSGESIDIDDSANATIRNIKITGKSIQDGTPTPENPVEIQNCSGSINFKAENKNLAWNNWTEDFVERINNSNLATITTKDNKRCLKARETAGYGSYDTKYLFKIDWKENTQYVISCKLFTEGSNSLATIAIVYTDGTIKDNRYNRIINNWTNFSLISEQNKTIKYLIINYLDGCNYIDLDTFMVEESPIPTTYIPHEEQTIIFPLQEGQVLAQDDYLADDGIHHVRKQVILNGTERIAGYSRDTDERLSFIISRKDAGDKIFEGAYTICTIMCTHFVNAFLGANGTSNRIQCLDPETMYFTIDKSVASTLDEVKTFLAEQYANSTPVIVEYVLSEEAQKEAIEPYTSQQAQAWEQIKALRTYKNITHISSEDETPATLEVTYVKDLPKEIDILSSLNLSVVDGLINIEYEEE